MTEKELIEFEENLKKLFKENKWDIIYILSRYFYKIGEPIITDQMYEKIEKYLKNNINNFTTIKEYINRTYDDDPIPINYLALVGYTHYQSLIDNNEEHFNLLHYLDEDKSLSIKSVTDYQEAFNWFKEHKGYDIMTSLKLDGNNTKSLYLDNVFKLSMSRGRAGNGFDFTKQIEKILPKFLNNNTNENIKELRIFSESFVDKDYLETLREKYKNSKYKTSKSSAISLLRVEHDEEDYKHLKTLVFRGEGFDTIEIDTVQKMFDKLEQLNFRTVPHKLINAKEIPLDDYNNFCDWLKINIFDYYFNNYCDKNQIGNDTLPSDGIVIEVNDYAYRGVTNNQYTTRQLALKFEQWQYAIYKSVVTDIVMEQQRVIQSCRVKIEPVKTGECTAEWVNCYNLSILINEGIKIGSTIYFERNSDAVNIILYGDKLKERLNGKEL